MGRGGRAGHEHPDTPRTPSRRGLPTWRIVRYADDFVVLVHGSRDDAQTLHEDIADVLAPTGSAALGRPRPASCT